MMEANMNVSEFQKKLNEICTIAESHHKVLTAGQVREHFQESELDRDQLLKILQYLKIKGITIEGIPNSSTGTEGQTQTAEEPQKTETVNSGTSTPLTEEEEAYLKEYLDGLAQADNGEQRDLEVLFAAAASGDEQALAALMRHYLPIAANMAAENNCAEIFLADLIQEANVGLLMALDELKGKTVGDAWMRSRIQEGILHAIEEQTERKFQDDYLVSKVQNLDTAMKELTEDDEEIRFSIDELAIILDMDVEEIRDVLRLAGEDE
jgi:RNA polymerase primary sigma factor